MRALLADIGGTNARFALLAEGAISPPLILPVAGFPSAEAAIAAALGQLAPQGKVERAVLALAAPVTSEPVRLTNAHWSLGSAAIAARFGFGRVRLVNDFLALAHALPRLAPADVLPIGGGTRDAAAPMIVLGPGTGLGMAAWLPGPRLALPTEAGHAGLASADPWEDAVLAALRARIGRASAEEALSGRGLSHLHGVVAALRGAAVPDRDAAAVVAALPHCLVAAEAVSLFLRFLAGFAGDMALAWGARGGVYLAGGILPRLLPAVDAAAFRGRFEAKAPLEAWMQAVPLAVVTHAAPAFLGLAALAEE
jgi:glucokinase